MRVHVLVEDLPKERDPKNDGFKIHGIFETKEGAETRVGRLHDGAKVRILSLRVQGNPLNMVDDLLRDLR